MERIIIAAFFAAVVISLALSSPVFAQQTGSTIYFHDNSELTFTYPPFKLAGFQVSGIQANPSSMNARLFQSATSAVPTGNGTVLSMSATISVSSQPQVYGAFVGWLSNPFPVNVTLDGNVVMHVWMSSNDSLLPWQGSEFFMGVADYSPTSSTELQVLDYFTSNVTLGNVFSGSPNEYVISTLRITHHQFQAGSMMLFLVGAGSNKQGYRFTVYFDSPTWESRADIPADASLTVTEFPSLTSLLIAILLLPILEIKCKPPSRCKAVKC